MTRRDAHNTDTATPAITDRSEFFFSFFSFLHVSFLVFLKTFFVTRVLI